MGVFDLMSQHGYGEIHLERDQASGLEAIIAIHDTRLGPALGGCRFIHYDTEEEALVDALRLARGMTYKAALAGLAHGGGKSVLIMPHSRFDRTALFRAFGRFVDDLRGHYITAEDSGTWLEDMDVIRTVTKHVTGVNPSHGGSGDPSPFTALGVRRGIEACVNFVLGRSSLEGIHVAVQGVGHVGYHLCRELHAQGAKLTVADVDPLKAERAQREFGAEIVPLEDIFDVECDVFAPCALGSAINPDTVPRLHCRIVAGAANNQLAEPRHGERPDAARHRLRARLRDQRRRPGQRGAGGDRLRRREVAYAHDEDLRHDPRDRRARTEVDGADGPHRRHDGRGAAVGGSMIARRGAEAEAYVALRMQRNS